MRSLGRAIEYEARRQIDLLEAGEEVRQETRHWDEGDGRTHTLRTKEDADDYRYFLEPDLVPLVPDDEWVERIRRRSRRCRPRGGPGSPRPPGAAPDSEAVTVVVERGQDDYVHAVVAAGGDGGRALVHVKEAYADQGAEPAVPAADLAALTRLEIDGQLTATQAKQVLAELVADGGGDPAAIAAAKGFEAMDDAALEAMVDEAIAANAGAWAKFAAGEDKAIGALVGAVMKASRGQADGQAVTALLRARAWLTPMYGGRRDIRCSPGRDAVRWGTTIYEFADCVVDPEQFELRRNGAIEHVEPQVFDVLVYLIRHRERVVPKTRAARQRLGRPVRQRVGARQPAQVGPPRGRRRRRRRSG